MQKVTSSWFFLSTLNYDARSTTCQIQYLEFRTKNYYNVSTQIKYDQECITSASAIKFLGLTIDDTLSCKQHIQHVLNKMCTACYALRNVKHIVPIDKLTVIYFAHIHSIISYGIIFWGSSSHANKVFILQNKIIRIITNTRPRDSCREVFKSMEIMTLYSQYIYSLSVYCKSTIYFRRHNNIMVYLLNFNITYIIIFATCFDSYESSSGINFKNYCTYCFTVFMSYSFCLKTKTVKT